MRKFLAFRSLMLVAAAVIGLNATAQNGAPHSVAASANLAEVTLSWKAPASPITLQWHDGSSYNGMDGKALTPGGTNVIYAANKFTPADLAAVAGQQVKSISFFDYRHCYKVNVQIYENKKLVADKAADLSTYEKNTMKEVVLDAPYTIPADKEVMFVARYEYSPVTALTASTDRYPTPGKGDIYSYDGKTWYQGAVGDFMITANVANDFTGQPQGYNVYRDGVKVNAEPLTGTSATLAGEPAGVHTYTVAAVYDGAEKVSAGVNAKVLVPASMLAPAATFSGTATELNGVLNWQAPLKGGNTLTWSGDVAGLSIGGTAASNTKVWIKQEFTANDLLAFQNYQINSISAYVNENSITAVTLFVIKDGVVVYNQPVADLAIQAPAWNTWDLATPYVMEPGHTYAFGCYYLHASTTHPVGVDNTAAVDVKGNSFSTSSPNSSNFNNSKPTWKTLASGSIAGNLMLKAAVSPVGEATAVAVPTGYDLYRNGELVASDIQETSFADEVAEPGLYEYTLATKYDGKDAPECTTSLKYTMPAEFVAPIITDASFDDATKKVDIAWSATAAELKKFGTASYMVGFDEDMTMLYGAKFTAAELAPYAGYKLSKLQFAIGEAIPFKLEVRTNANEVLFSYDFPQGSIEPLSLYTMSLESNVVIPEGKDLYLCYNMTAAGGSEPILLDAGPVVDGGAMISLADGASWMKLGTINSTYNNYNIVIGATAIPAGSNAPKQEITLGTEYGENMESISISAAQAREAAVNGLGIEANVKASVPAKAAKVAPKPVVKSFKVVRNGEVVATTEGTAFSETLNEFGTFNYNVVTVFENGWESPASKTFTVENFIAQNAPAPFDLRGQDEDGDLNLVWDAPGLVQEFTYQKDYSSDLKSGMTGSGTREGYHVIRFTMDTLQTYVGQKITHIKFKLSEAVTTAAVVITCGENVIYEQKIDAADINVGWNVIRLNTPFEITAGIEQELGVGYHITYPNGVKPFTLDPTPAIPYYNDLISAAASYGYWYSLQAKYKLNYGYRISAVLQKQDTQAARKVARKADAELTYNVYCNGSLIADGITECGFTVMDAEDGDYTVTAVNNGVESAPSNAVAYTKTIVGVNDVNGAKGVASVRYINAAGIEATAPFEGVNIMVTTYSDGTKTATKVVK